MQATARYTAVLTAFTACAVLCQTCAFVGLLTLALQADPNCTTPLLHADQALLTAFQGAGLLCLGFAALCLRRLLNTMLAPPYLIEQE